MLCGGKRKISYKKIGRTFLYDDNIPYAENPSTNLGLAIERRLSLLTPLNLNFELDGQPKLFLDKSEKDFADKIFENHKVNKSKKTVMISLLGSEKLKTYPLQYMTEIIDFISDTYNVNILFNYFPKQLEEAKIVFNSCKKSTQQNIYFDLLGSNLREYIAIMDNCDIIIGNDGGAINLAKALNKPSFIIFSPWIEKKIWATFEDGKKHLSIHLNDIEPNLISSKTEKELKEIESSSASSIKSNTVFKGNNLNIIASSASTIDMEVEYENITVEASSTSDIMLRGKTLKLETNLGRLTVSKAFGDTDGDGDYEQLATAKDVTELAINRCRDSRRD